MQIDFPSRSSHSLLLKFYKQGYISAFCVVSGSNAAALLYLTEGIIEHLYSILTTRTNRLCTADVVIAAFFQIVAGLHDKRMTKHPHEGLMWWRNVFFTWLH